MKNLIPFDEKRLQQATPAQSRPLPFVVELFGALFLVSTAVYGLYKILSAGG